ncbi:MAG: caspase family protein, partial [Rhodocyclales bacterium]|nr:caspase family protein [Rhodocyclales bacterium]
MLTGFKALPKFLLACALAATAAGLPSVVAAAEQKVALIIGNAAYPTSRLRNPVNDAKAMAEKLRALGFDVVLRTDTTQRDMTRAISQFGQKLVLGSVGLFYYAGHGMQVRGKNFLIPIDAEIETEGSVSSEAVDVDQVLNQLGPARLSMVILDACRNNPFERKFRSSGGGGLAQIDAPTGTLLAYATAPGKVAADGTGNNGVYTEALLKALDMPGLKVEDVFKQVRINVLKSSDNQQTPWESSSLTGEFYFSAPAKPTVAAFDDSKFRQAEKERAELLAALQDERKKRDQDADLIKREMEKLRAELLQMRTAPAPAAPVPSAPAIAAPAPVAPAPVAPTVIAAAKPTSAPPPPQPQIAVTPPAAPPVTPSATATTDWKPRIALLEQSRGKLSLSKAMAILLDISSADDLSMLLAHELKIKGLIWQTAYAMGVDSTGNIVWGGSYRWGNPGFATNTALEFCGKTAGAACKAVFANGDFKEQDFIEVVKALGTRSVGEVRTAYM